MNVQEEPLVRVAVAPNEPLARMWAETLENDGISCMIKPVTGPGTASVWAAGIIEHEIWVRKSQAEQAVSLLTALEESDDEMSVDDETEDRSGI